MGWGTILVCATLVSVSHEMEVAGLVRQLGAEDFQTRERASTELARRLPQALPQLRRASRSPDLEITRRAEFLVAEYYDVKPSDYEKIPWIDMLPGDLVGKDEIIKRYLERCSYGARYGSYNTDYYDYREATRLYVLDLMTEQDWTRDRARALLDRMVLLEKDWLAKRGQPQPK